MVKKLGIALSFLVIVLYATSEQSQMPNMPSGAPLSPTRQRKNAMTDEEREQDKKTIVNLLVTIQVTKLNIEKK